MTTANNDFSNQVTGEGVRRRDERAPPKQSYRFRNPDFYYVARMTPTGIPSPRHRPLYPVSKNGKVSGGSSTKCPIWGMERVETQPSARNRCSEFAGQGMSMSKFELLCTCSRRHGPSTNHILGILNLNRYGIPYPL